MSILLSPLSRLNRVIRRMEEGAVCIFLAMLITLSMAQIIGRAAWIDPVLRHLTVWTGLVGASLATDEGKHITIDIFSRALSDKALRRLSIFLHLFSAMIAFLLLWAAIIFIGNEMDFGSEREVLFLPAWSMNTVFAWAFGVMGFRFLLAALSGECRGNRERRGERAQPAQSLST